MDTGRFDAELNASLVPLASPPTAVNPVPVYWNAADRASAMYRAIRAWSIWHPCKRRVGTGSLVSGGTAGSNSAVLTGGPYPAGANLKFDVWGQTEQIVVQSTVPYLPGTDGVGSYSQVTFQTDFVDNHPVGAFISQASLGLSIVAGTDTYQLPYDWLKPDQETFDIATGQRFGVRQFESFYDGVYYYSELLSGIGWGQSQTIGLGTNFFGPNAALFGIPDAAGFTIPGANGRQTLLDFLPGTPPILTIGPTPTVTQTWDFFYYSLHSPDTVADGYMEGLLAFARWAAITAKQSWRASQLPYKDDDTDSSDNESAAELDKAAKSAWNEWSQFVQRPFMISG